MENIKALIALAPHGYKIRDVLRHLRADPYQTRVSIDPILLTHPRKLIQRVISEYVDDLIGDSRFAIEAEDGLVYISRLRNSSLGSVFLPVAVESGGKLTLLHKLQGSGKNGI